MLLVGVAEWAWLESPRGSAKGRARGFFARLAEGPSGCPANGQKSSNGSADYSWQIRTLDGRATRLEEFRGKVLFVNVWATWCGPCVSEMPDIQGLYNSLQKDSNVAFLLVSEEEDAPVRTFVTENKITAPVFISNATMPGVFESRGIPATFIVDRAGAIVHKRIGAAHWDDESCRAFLRSLL